jgi:hypothetical protein
VTRKSLKKIDVAVSKRAAASGVKLARLPGGRQRANGSSSLERKTNGHAANGFRKTTQNGRELKAATEPLVESRGKEAKVKLASNGHGPSDAKQLNGNGHAALEDGTASRMNGHSAPVISRMILQDQQLVERCVSGEPTAWSQIYERFHGSLIASIRAFLGRAGQDIHLVDEISARVWYSLVRNGFELLAKFDITRGCRLSTFLSVLAKTEARMLLRSERRRKTRERVASRNECEGSGGQGLSNEEFINMLSPAEREFYLDVLVAGSTDSERYSRQNHWQLRHRVRRKLETYLE